MASSYKFCVIATGEYDIYAARERANEWDYAAGHAVAANAGAIITTLDGIRSVNRMDLFVLVTSELSLPFDFKYLSFKSFGRRLHCYSRDCIYCFFSSEFVMQFLTGSSWQLELS